MRNNILKKTMALLLVATIAVTSANVSADAKSEKELAREALDAADKKAKASDAKCDVINNPDTFDEALEYEILDYLSRNEGVEGSSPFFSF